MSTILVLTNLADGDVDTPTLELLTLARELGNPVALIVGDAPSAAVTTLGRYGVTAIHALDCPQLAGSLVTARSALVADAASAVGADVVLLAAGLENAEVAALVAAALGAALVTDAVAAATVDGALRVTKVIWAGRHTVEADVRTPRAVLTVKANAITPSPDAAGGTVLAVEVGTRTHETARDAVVTSLVADASTGGPRLSDASVVVAGGRGTDGDFTGVVALAELLGGAVGASRAAVDAGWIGIGTQVGQTGRTVSPDLYVAVGISGAIQHVAGMRTARRIVAVNSDPDAPIHRIADLGVVGDLAVILPAAVERLRAHAALEGASR
ncbi:electron transfer flavoprotein subunit alpha/FixB family protein [Pengzhenrongella frigida]|uniref:Electron transfer flavoprotein subunit alpha/FixB family protein n=1 Tax=Pengzhenrongella frigida TaxID=1259133 RepID=A0A4V1ZGT1_9MICO|nr:electron transfer flavoprotein subunit alpha/FixB family protein [Cellulomonas sp. HLT2-17]RYV49624.1 electron transfer flavoprotein subunit alpha/FixB family protein [Cellulomonas sp. HLT2-17]